AAQRHRTASRPHASRAVTLSNENALSRFRARPHPQPQAFGGPGAAQGVSVGPRGRCHTERTTGAGTAAVPGVPSRRPYDPFPLGMPLGGVERPRRAVRFARLIHRRGRVLGGPAVRATPGGSLSLTWLPRTVVPNERRAATCSPPGRRWTR